jgi:acyl carrier protein
MLLMSLFMSKYALVMQRCCSVLGLKIEELEKLTSLSSLENWDSLAQIQLITVLEESSGIELTMEQALHLTPEIIREIASK